MRLVGVSRCKTAYTNLWGATIDLGDGTYQTGHYATRQARDAHVIELARTNDHTRRFAEYERDK